MAGAEESVLGHKLSDGWIDQLDTVVKGTDHVYGKINC